LQAGDTIPTHLTALDDSLRATGATAVGASKQTLDSFLRTVSKPPVVFVSECELTLRGEETMRSRLERSPKEWIHEVIRELDTINSDDKTMNQLQQVKDLADKGHIETAPSKTLALIYKALALHKGYVKSLRDMIDLELSSMATPAGENQRGRLQALSALIKPREQMIELLLSRQGLIKEYRAVTYGWATIIW